MIFLLIFSMNKAILSEKYFYTLQNVRVKQQNHVMLMIFCFNHSGKICGMGFDAAGAAQAANNIPTSVCTGN